MAYNQTEIRALLERYFDGETSLAEERALSDYFASSPSIPADLEYARAMFGHFAHASGQAFTPAPEVCHIASTDATGSATNQTSLPDNGTAAAAITAPHGTQSASAAPAPKPRKRRRKIIAWAGSAAAAIAAGLILTFTLISDREVVYCYVNGEPVTDYDLAYAYTQGALGLIVDNVRKPQEHLLPIEELERSLESLRYLELLGLFSEENE